MLASPLYGRFCLLARPALLSTCARLEAQIRPIPDALANFVFSRKSSPDRQWDGDGKSTGLGDR